MQLTLSGESSQEKKIIPVRQEDLQKTVLEFLRENDIPVASSCRGLGICEKCIINKDVLSCEWTIQDFIKKKGSLISISYL